MPNCEARRQSITSPKRELYVNPISSVTAFSCFLCQMAGIVGTRFKLTHQMYIDSVVEERRVFSVDC
jgi:hypothetical protein